MGKVARAGVSRSSLRTRKQTCQADDHGGLWSAHSRRHIGPGGHLATPIALALRHRANRSDVKRVFLCAPTTCPLLGLILLASGASVPFALVSILVGLPTGRVHGSRESRPFVAGGSLHVKARVQGGQAEPRPARAARKGAGISDERLSPHHVQGVYSVPCLGRSVEAAPSYLLHDLHDLQSSPGRMALPRPRTAVVVFHSSRTPCTLGPHDVAGCEDCPPVGNRQTKRQGSSRLTSSYSSSVCVHSYQPASNQWARRGPPGPPRDTPSNPDAVLVLRVPHHWPRSPSGGAASRWARQLGPVPVSWQAWLWLEPR